MHGNAATTLVVLGALLLAGCAAGGTGSDVGSPADGPSGPGAAPGDATGVVRGLVVDDVFSPLDGASVGITELDLLRATNGEGFFEFGDVAPGTYTVAAQKLGYSSAAKRVEVVAGQVTEVNLALAVVEIVEPFVDVKNWEGFIECQIGTAAVLANCVPIQNILNQNDLPNPTNTEQIGFFLVEEPRNETIGGLYELLWEKATAYTADELFLSIEPENTGLGGGYESDSGPSVLRVEVTDNEPYTSVDPSDPDNDEVQVRVFAAGRTPPTLVLQQRFTVWSSVFYFAHPGEAYSALGDA